MSEAWDKNAESSQIGMEYFFRSNMLERILDFMLGPKSPLARPGESRTNMSGGYVPANFSALMQVVTAMVSDTALL